MDIAEAKTLHGMTVGQVQRWMRDIIELHERTAIELRQYANRFATVADDERHGIDGGDVRATPVEALAWFVNATKNLPTNMRLDCAANHGAALAMAAATLANATRP